MFNAFNANELRLNKAMHVPGLKRPSQALEVTDILKGCSVDDLALIAYALEFIQFILMLERLGFGR